MEMSIRMNSKKILEYGNETIALKDNISLTIEEKSAEFSLYCEDENRELKNTINIMEQSIEKIMEEMTSLKENIVKNEESANKYLDSVVRINQEITILKHENKELKKINQEIESSLNGVYGFVQKRQIIM